MVPVNCPVVATPVDGEKSVDAAKQGAVGAVASDGSKTADGGRALESGSAVPAATASDSATGAVPATAASDLATGAEGTSSEAVCTTVSRRSSESFGTVFPAKTLSDRAVTANSVPNRSTERLQEPVDQHWAEVAKALNGSKRADGLKERDCSESAKEFANAVESTGKTETVSELEAFSGLEPAPRADGARESEARRNETMKLLEMEIEPEGINPDDGVKLPVALNTAVGAKVAVWGIVGQSGVTSSGNGVRSNVAPQEFPLSVLRDVGIGFEKCELNAHMDPGHAEASYPTSTVLFTKRQPVIVMVTDPRAKTTAKPCWAVLLKKLESTTSAAPN
jgi:hypothetical protein